MDWRAAGWIFLNAFIGYIYKCSSYSEFVPSTLFKVIYHLLTSVRVYRIIKDYKIIVLEKNNMEAHLRNFFS